MGTVFPRQSDNMKFFAVLALAAVAFAEPEAEGNPALLYGSYGYPYAGGVYGGYRAYGAYPATYGYGYRTYGYGKRSADAEPEADAEADPAVLYGSYGYPYAGVYGGYRAYGAYPYSYYGKRSADAEPEADPALLYTTSNVVAPLTTAYTGVPQTIAYTHTVAAPTVVKATVPATYAALPQVTYAGVPHTYAAVPVTTVAKAPAHGVAATYAGLVHSSHVGVCLNNVGVQVPC